MSKTPLKRIVSAEDLISRWGMPAEEIDQICRNRNLRPYSFEGNCRKRNDSEEYHYCKPLLSQLPEYISFEDIVEYGPFCLKGVVFDLSEVENYEFRNGIVPKLVPDENEKESVKSPAQGFKNDGYISFFELAKHLSKSPVQADKFMCEHSLPWYTFGQLGIQAFDTGFQEIYPGVYGEAYLHVEDLKPVFEGLQIPLPSSTALSEDCSHFHKRIAELEAQLAEAKAGTEALTPKEEQTAAAYQKDIEVAVVLAVECANDGETRSTEYHKTRWKELLSEKGIQSQRYESFRAFRRALPASLKEDDPGKKNGEKPSS